jgi:hypothetical protein
MIALAGLRHVTGYSRSHAEVRVAVSPHERELA